MPTEARWFIRTSLVYLAVTAVSGAFFFGMRWRGIAVPWHWISAHAHAALVGWLVSVVAGVAFWMFPLDRRRFPGTRGRYRPLRAWGAYAGIHGGLLIRMLVEPTGAGYAPTGAGVLFLSGLLQAAGILLFVIEIWTRVRPPLHPAPSRDSGKGE